MLLSLKVQNYALIDELYVEFHQGLNIITGETGAGKSILLGALGLILGKRADTSVLSNNEHKCVVEAEFNISNHNLGKIFIENDIDFDKHTVFRREILSSGKSRAFINDTPVNLNILQVIGQHLVDIHSQHQNLLLNEQSFLLNVVDTYCNAENLLNEYTSIYTKYIRKQKEYSESLSGYNSVKEELDLINHQFNLLNDASLKTGEIEDLEDEVRQLENAGEIKMVLHEAEEILNSEEKGAIDILNTLATKLQKIQTVFSKGGGLSSRLESVLIELKDIENEISGSFDKLEFDPEYHVQRKDRLDLLNSLLQRFRKTDINELIEVRNQFAQKLSVAVDGEYDLKKQKQELDTLHENLNIKAKELSGKRLSVFNEIEASVTSMLKDMGILHAQVSLVNREKDFSANGSNEINLFFTANKNHPLQDVSKIASGGELSRLMLAVKALISGSKKMPTLILDEIDTGVSGDIADKVGKIIKNMCGQTQIINITHLPQVASKGEVHYLVYKDHNHNLTRTLIKKLNDKERVYEIAKMLSGEQLSDAAIENARVLLGL